MKQSTFNYIKQILKDYPDIDDYIKHRKEELTFPYRHDDVNADIKGKGNNSDRVANLMITLEQDRRLAILERNKRVIQYNLEQCDENTRIIIDELYMKRYPRYRMNGLVANNEVNFGRNKAIELRNNFFENIANDLGLDI